MAADKHYATDVIVGSIVGAAFGFAVPRFFHRRVASAPTGQSASAFALSVTLPL